MARKATIRTLQPIDDLRDAVGEVDLFVEGYLYGAAMLHNRHDELNDPHAWSAFSEASPLSPLQRIRLDMSMEQNVEQAEKGFPILFGLVAVSLAAHLEVAVRELCLLWLRDHKEAWSLGPILRIELPATEFASARHVERCSMLLERLEASVRGSESGGKIKPGVEPLLRLLGSLSIAPKPSPSVTRAINELVAVRNQLLHHGGRVTPRFAELCPSLATRKRHVVVSEEMYSAYVSAISDFADSLAAKAMAVGGIPEE